VSLETIALSEELRKLDAAHRSLRESEAELRRFILSPEFLTDYIGFETRLGNFQDCLVTLAEALRPGPQAMILPAPQAPGQTPAGEARRGLGIEGALVAVAAVAAVSIASTYGYVPPSAAVATAAGALILAFLPQIRDLASSIVSHLREGEGEEAGELNLESWASDSLAKLRSLYTAARFLTKIQSQKRESLPNYALPGMDDALYDREKYFKETLPAEFLSVVGQIMVVCDRNVWERRSLLISAMAASRMQQQREGSP
jgi:hypothetical protein